MLLKIFKELVGTFIGVIVVKGLFEFIQTKYPEIPESIKAEKVLNEEMEEKLVKAIAEFKEEF